MTPDMATKYDLVALLAMKANNERVKGPTFLSSLSDLNESGALDVTEYNCEGMPN